jgi:hypothetical protein
MCVELTKVVVKTSGVKVVTFSTEAKVLGCLVTIPGWRGVFGKAGNLLDIHEPNHQFTATDQETGKPVMRQDNGQPLQIRMPHIECEEALALKGKISTELIKKVKEEGSSAAEALAKAGKAMEAAKKAGTVADAEEHQPNAEEQEAAEGSM